jgi:hypothetical protein
MFINNNIILERYIKIALNNFENVLESKKHYNFRCNVCGDGHKRNNKRGHIKFDKRKNFFYFKCFNEGCEANSKAWPGESWLKFTSKDLYKQYVREILSPSNDKKNIEKLDKIKFKKIIKPKKEIDDLIILDEKSNNEYVKKAIQYCRSRLVSKTIWKKWYVCEKGTFKNRLIIPFYNDKKDMIYYQGRSLGDDYPKYLNKEDGKDDAIYNYYSIDKKKPVYVFEGIFDSLCIPNSIAILGLSMTDVVQNKIDELDTKWIMDNDSSGIEKSKKLLKKGNYVFLWKEFLKDFGMSLDIKDMNEFKIKYMKQKDKKIVDKKFEEYFTNSHYDLIKL